ncbi:MAG: hemerythrin domain-containing protein [Magnetospirillum sp.]|nr:hemerythrin domain-containing protein [Magnetospirillum sp.]
MSFDDDFRACWNDAFLVGDAHIDAQHRAFFDEVNAVSTVLEQGSGREAVIDFYRAFTAALITHFRDEEAMLERLGYAGLERHRGEHEALLSAVASVEGLLLTGNDLHHWRLVVRRLFAALVDHLAGSDMRYKSLVLRSRAE